MLQVNNNKKRCHTLLFFLNKNILYAAKRTTLKKIKNISNKCFSVMEFQNNFILYEFEFVLDK